GRPRVGRLFFRYFADVNTLLTNLLAGAVDASGPAPSGIFFGQGLQLEELIAQGRAPGLVVKFGPTTVFDALVLNHDVPFFRDRRVRQALAHATDRESISQALFKGKQPVAHSFISSHFPGYLQSIRKYPYDLDRARALLQEAGYTMGSDGVLRAPDGSRFSVVFTVATGNRDRERAQQVIRENWRRIGVEAVIQNLPSRVISAEMYFQRRYRGLLINSHSANADYSNADRFFASWEVRPVGESSRNVLGYRNARMDELIRQYLQEPDEAKRMRKLQEWQAFFAEELPLIPLYAWTAAWAYKEGLENFQPTGTSGIPSPFTWNAHLWQWRK
ncbi:MAG: hypothetical protein HY660_17580, partial [Armatimonadetes bacterium]|nr:hypothetical protein [Armatimonadota bacterium]